MGHQKDWETLLYAFRRCLQVSTYRYNPRIRTVSVPQSYWPSCWPFCSRFWSSLTCRVIVSTTRVSSFLRNFPPIVQRISNPSTVLPHFVSHGYTVRRRRRRPITPDDPFMCRICQWSTIGTIVLLKRVLFYSFPTASLTRPMTNETIFYLSYTVFSRGKLRTSIVFILFQHRPHCNGDVSPSPKFQKQLEMGLW